MGVKKKIRINKTNHLRLSWKRMKKIKLTSDTELALNDFSK